MCDQATLSDLFRSTCSPAAASGPTPCETPDGQTVARSGPVPAHASLSARQARERGLLTSGTFGPPRIGSSPSSSLSASLASRLRTKVRTLGSTLYNLTWKEWTTPSGVCRLRLRASVRRTHVIALSGWPTPLAADSRGSAGVGKKELPNIAALAGWATPTANTPGGTAEQALARKEGLNCGQSVTHLAHQAQLAGWSTPIQNDSEKQGSPAPGNGLPSEAILAAWPTPVSSDAAKAENAAYRPGAVVLGNAAMLTGWPTPCAQDGPNGGPSQGTDRLPGAAAQVLGIRGRLTASGQMSIGCSAETPEAHAGGPLTLEHSLWLQAIPREWADCVSAATRSMPKSRKASSKR